MVCTVVADIGGLDVEEVAANFKWLVGCEGVARVLHRHQW
jgi:hypothetical protein